MAVPAGTWLGPYEVLAPLGAGGMGEVYRARDRRLGREVALKVLAAALAGQPGYAARFQREMQALAAMSHPNLLAIYDTGEEQGIIFAVTELLTGETLRTRLGRAPGSRLDWRLAVEIAAALAEGLAAAHGSGIVHRDLKPENVFLTASGVVKVLDFGLARELALVTTAATDQTNQTTLAGAALCTPTQPGLLLGTPGYLSPEQARGEAAGPASDIFALGCVLYEMLAGRRAFSAALTSVLQDTPPAVGQSGLGLPAELDRLLAGCLQKNPEQRLQSARDLAVRCRELLSSGSGGGTEGVQAAGPVTSIAVLPFANPGRDPDAEYLCDGIAENLINRLAALTGLRVTPRSVAFQHKESAANPLAIGRELGVRAILSGRLQERAGTLVVGVELADVAQGTQLWGERYRRPVMDLFELEDDLAGAIAAKLKLKLSGEEQQRGHKRGTENPEAYQLYLRGRHHWVRRSIADLRQGAVCFQQAIDRDPAFALAYAGLADCHSLLGAYGDAPFRESLARARAAAAAAVAMDPNAAETHASLGLSLFAGAAAPQSEREFRKAIELDPGLWVTHYWYGYYLTFAGRLEEAETQYQAALALEPLNPLVAFLGASIGHIGRRYELSGARARAGLECSPDHPLLHFQMGLALVMSGQLPEAAAEAERLLAVAGEAPLFQAVAASILARSGQRERAAAMLASLRQDAAARHLSRYVLATVALEIGDRASALADIEQDVKSENATPIFLPLDPRLDPLRDEPVFQAAMRHWMATD